jgi:2-keto-4-pentenoate hydratase/2-oxohepta-3-ene-1,7-dioic acid hydratase in catechol pathway
MKLMRYSGRHEAARHARLGVLVGDNLVADVRAGYARYLVESARNPKGQQIADIYFPPYIVQFLHAGEAVWLALSDAHGYLSELAGKAPDATGLGDEDLFMPLADCRLYAPLRPSKLVCIAGNYGQGDALDERRLRKPNAFIKTLSAIVGPERDIMKPAACHELACETELAVVIGKKCKHVSEADAYSVIAGYTIINDVTACDIGTAERDAGHLFLGKTYDTFAPMGPWIVTRGGIPDAMNLRIGTRVNGEVRQEGHTRDMLVDIPKLIAHLSQITLMPGDVIATGSPDGRALDRAAAVVDSGDLVESEIEGIGILRNRVIDEPDDDCLNFSD